MWVSIYLSIYLSIYQIQFLSIYLSIYLSNTMYEHTVIFYIPIHTYEENFCKNVYFPLLPLGNVCRFRKGRKTEIKGRKPIFFSLLFINFIVNGIKERKRRKKPKKKETPFYPLLMTLERTKIPLTFPIKQELINKVFIAINDTFPYFFFLGDISSLTFIVQFSISLTFHEIF